MNYMKKALFIGLVLTQTVPFFYADTSDNLNFALEDIIDASQQLPTTTASRISDAAALAGIASLAPIAYWLTDQGCQNDFEDVFTGNQNSVEKRGKRGMRNAQNRTATYVANDSSWARLFGMNSDDQVMVKVNDAIGYPRAIKYIPDVTKRIITISAVGSLALIAVGYNITQTLMVLRDTYKLRSKMTTLNNLLKQASLDELHKILLIARDYKRNSPNAHVVSSMKRVEQTIRKEINSRES